jgi:hypothetical protein
MFIEVSDAKYISDSKINLILIQASLKLLIYLPN